MTSAALPLPILILTGFLSGAGIRLADPLLALIASDFEARVAAAAPVVAGFTLAYGLAQPVLGPLGDRFGKLRLIAVCMACYGAATLAAALAPSLGALTVARAVAGAFAGGPFVQRFEKDFAAYCGVKHCVAVGTGTDALWLA
ncbi:MAG: MFS transporter, partial [Elioraea tepidiphila]